MFGIKSVVLTTTVAHQVLHPVTGSAVGATVTLAGPEHPQRKAFEFAAAREARRMFQKKNRVTLTDPEDDVESNTDKLVACTLGWEGFADDDEKPIAFSAEAARKLYADPDLAWLRMQLIDALHSLEGFIKG